MLQCSASREALLWGIPEQLRQKVCKEAGFLLRDAVLDASRTVSVFIEET
jgi:hypothetical protein